MNRLLVIGAVNFQLKDEEIAKLNGCDDFVFIDDNKNANFCWIFFRADSLSNAFDVIKQIFYTGAGIRQSYTWVFFALAIAIGEIIFAICNRKKNSGKLEQEYLSLNLSKVWPLAMFLTLIGITIMMAYVGDTAFIYGNF